MKQILLLIAFLLASITAGAQNFEFLYKGESLQDGATVIIAAEEDDFGDLSCETNPPSDPGNGLVLKLLNASSAQVTASAQVISNTLNPLMVQWCMGGTCTPMIGNFVKTKTFTAKSIEQVQFDATNIQSEGTLTATLSVQLGGTTRTVNIQFVNSDTDGIKEVKSEKVKSEKTAGVYDLSGRKINFQFSTFNSQLRSGVYIVNGKKYIK